MKIGIIIHSKTGTTLCLGKLIANRLEERGHEVKLLELKTNIPVKSGSVRSAPHFQIVHQPDGKDFDALVIGGPVWAFSASPVIIKAVKGLKHVKGKKILPITTMGFALRGMGGTQAIKLLSKELASSGAVVLPGIIIPKMFHNLNRIMIKAAEESIRHFEA